MDILYVGTLPPHPGGSAVVAGQVLPRLAQRGHRIRAVSGTTELPDRMEAIDRAALPGVSTHRYRVAAHHIDTARTSLALVRSEAPGLRAALRRAIAHGHPEVLVAGRSNFALHVAGIARALRVPFVQVQHSRYGSGEFDPTDLPRARRLRDRTGRAGAHLLVADNLREVYVAPDAPIVVARNAAETDLFRPAPRDAAFAARWAIPADALVILHASNLKPVKRALDIVAAAPAIVARVPNAHLVFVGDGPDRAALVEGVRAAGLEQHVTFAGWRDRAEMPAWYALADIVVMPSETEALALAVLETMASGRVLVATDIPGSREAATDGHDALLVPVGDIACLAACIVRAATDAGLRTRLGAAARQTALGWGIDDTVSCWEAALAAALARHGPSRDLAVARGPVREA